MIVAPVARRVEAALPDAGAAPSSLLLLGPVGARRNGKAFADHHRGEVPALNGAGGENSAISVVAIGLAFDRPATQQFRHAIAGHMAAGPLAAPCPVALLREFWRIEAEEADAGLADAKAVPVAGARPASQRSPGLIECGGDKGGSCQDQDSEKGSAAGAEDRLLGKLSAADFTTR